MRRAISVFEPGFARKQLSGQMIGFGLWAAITAVALVLRPDPSGHGTHTQLGLPPCPSVLLFDRPCPGCGLTTSFSATVHGDFAAAFAAHPLGPALYLAFTAYALAGLFGWIKRWRLASDSRWANRVICAAAIAFLVFGGYRAIAQDGYGNRPQEKIARAVAR